MTQEMKDDVVRDMSGETVQGFRVAAWRETHPEHGDKYGHIYSEHWSTPNTRHPAVTVERLFTEGQLRASFSRADALETENAALRGALTKIEKWFGQFPETGQIHSDGSPVSYSALYGSNGERDFMRQIARTALGETQ
jgi:hypothetical protein